MKFFRKLLGREEAPADVAARLATDERVLAIATLRADEYSDEEHLVVTSHGLWLPGQEGVGHVGWHLVSKATWGNGVLTLVEAEEAETIGGAVLVTDLPPRRLRLAEPGRVPETVHARVEASIRSRHHRDLPGGGAWFVQRKVPGRDGIVLQVRPDPGTDVAVVRQVVADVERTLGRA
ncbi:hypothetical protein FHX44_111275 [Pseudonocardia hierapolitana]|uniref:Uncharacterized protein n=1 Tax=Pseudonocardia hierapolitana TaxID=1128676 RepID=A0A561SKI0_9PSEU|nr:hypothetical protein [Pseudonocardia hierapolitana]TWF75391.1 hypothetical protein FHX44_111275 [Pseudonocardia hierapolitana]